MHACSVLALCLAALAGALKATVTRQAQLTAEFDVTCALHVATMATLNAGAG